MFETVKVEAQALEQWTSFCLYMSMGRILKQNLSKVPY